MHLQLMMKMDDGTVLSAATDLELARKWAAHIWGEAWARVSHGRQSVEVAAALREIVRAHKG